MHYTSGEAVRVRGETKVAHSVPASAPEPSVPLRRRVFHCTAGLKLERVAKPLYLKATLLADAGVCVLHDSPLPRNEPCKITLSMFTDGKRILLAAEGCTGESVCAGATFRIGIRFTHLDETDGVVLARLLRG